MNKQMVTLGMTLFLLIGSQQGWASVPLSINYSGELVETTTGAEREMTDKNGFFYVRLYASPTSTQPLWARQYSVILNKGKFNIEISEGGGSEIIGASTASLQEALRLQATDPLSDALYIGVRPLEDLPIVEILPRQRVVSVPFAMLANDVVAARRNFTVLNGQVRIKNLTVLKSAVFSNNLTIAAAQGTTEVHFASSPRFVGGMVSSLVDKKVQIANNTTVSGPATFNNGLTVTSLTSTAASTLNNGLVVKGTSAFNGGLTAKSGMTVGSSGSTLVGGSITASNGISVTSSGFATITNLTAVNIGSFFPAGSILDSTLQEYTVSSSATGNWLATKDCFVIASVTFDSSGIGGNKVATKFYASPTATVGTGTLLTEVGMGTSAAASESGFTTYQGTTTASFFLKSGEYLTWSSERGTITLKLVWRSFTYSF